MTRSGGRKGRVEYMRVNHRYISLESRVLLTHGSRIHESGCAQEAVEKPKKHASGPRALQERADREKSEDLVSDNQVSIISKVPKRLRDCEAPRRARALASARNRGPTEYDRAGDLQSPAFGYYRSRPLVCARRHL